jgi:rhamnose utilization protein RhaD (predicted bifunctional aldolase and dehydrogenase)
VQVGGQPVAVVPGSGVLVAEQARPSVLALVDFLADVARVLPGEVRNALRPRDEDELLGWDAEHHRQALSRARGGARTAGGEA